MRKLFLILFLFPIIAKSQTIADTTIYISNEGETIKVVSYRNAATTNIPTTTRLKDSIAVVRALIPDVTGKANLASPTFTGTVGGITAAMVGLGNVTNESKATMFTNPAFTGTPTGITKTQVGLGNVDNTSDANKPISSAEVTALGLKQNSITTGTTLQYFRGDLSLATFPTTTSFLTSSANKNFVNDAQLVIVGNTSGANTGDNSANTTYANDFRAANFVAGTNYLAPSGSAASLTNFPTLNQNTSGTAAGLSAVLSFANGGISAAAATSATTGTMTVNMTSSMITITPTGACTFNASGGVAGQVVTFLITTSGVSSFVLTFGTNFRSTGTLATGTTSARFFSVTFVCVNGTTWQEQSRTIVQQ